MQRCLLLLLLLTLPVTLLLAQPPVPPPPPPPVEEPGYTFFSEIMPVLRECQEDFETPQERKECTDEVVMGLVQHHLRWPPLVDSFEGIAVVSFTVEKNGSLQNFKVVRDPGAGSGEEALRAVKLMAKATEPWVPGKNGRQQQPSVVRMNLPVRFKLY